MNSCRSTMLCLLLQAILIIALTSHAHAQREINIWYFGNQAGLDFNIPPATTTAPAEVTTSAMTTSEGSAIATDRTTGALLFYTNGLRVWDRTNTEMPGASAGNLLGGGGSSTQAVLVVPDPANTNRYYLFTTPDLGSGPAEFNIVDMTARGGLGDVVVRRQPLPILTARPPDRVCEKIAATRDAAGTGFWVLFHEFTTDAAGSNAFYAYHLSATGIDAMRISNVGTPISSTASNARGEMKLSPDGVWLATANEAQVAELFRFNNSNGAVNAVVTLDSGQPHYGVSFSPNSRLLYINDGWNATPRSIDQFNLATPTAAAITASRTEIAVSSIGSLGAMQIAPDGRIYIARNGATSLGVINCPNVPGTGCDYADIGFTFTGTRTSSWGLPNLILESVATPEFAGPDTAICAGESVRIGLTPLTGYIYRWNAHPSLSNPNIANPVATPTATTSYPLEITTPRGCTERDTITVTVNPLPTIVTSNNAAICDGESTQLTASGGTIFSWNPVAGLSDPTIANPIASPTTTTTYTVTVTDANGCSNTADITVTVNPAPTVSAGNDATICAGESTRLSATASPGVTFLWEPATGLDDPTLASPMASPAATTAYRVIVTNTSSCRDTATVTVTVNARPVASAGSDVTICAGENTPLLASGGVNYRWEPTTGLSTTNSPATTASPVVTTTYNAIVTNGAGCADTATVTVTVNPLPVVTVSPPDTICAGQGASLSASGGTIYRWSPLTGLSDPTIANPIATPLVSTIYRVVVENENGCRDSADVPVTVITPSVRLALPDTLADPHQHGYRIPIRLSSDEESAPCIPDSFTVELEFNASLFMPTGVTRGTITRNQVMNGRRIVAITFDASTPVVTAGVLTEMIGDVLLGDSVSTPLLFRSIEWTGVTVAADSINGRLALTPVCIEGGERLLNFGDGFGVTKIAPNPGSTQVLVEVQTVELGATRLSVYSSSGTEMFATEWVAEQSAATGGELRQVVLPPDLPSGVYQIVLITPARRDTKSLVITK